MPDVIELSPSQASYRDAILRELPNYPLAQLSMDSGRGRTVVLEAVQRVTGGQLLRMKDFFEALARQPHPLAIEEAVYQLIRAALEEHDVVIVDDFHQIQDVVQGCGNSYPRPGLLNVPAVALAEYLQESGKKLVYGTGYRGPRSWGERAACWSLHSFAPADYRFLIDAFAGERGRDLDVEAIHRFATGLDARQLQQSCRWLVRQPGPVSTDQFIEYLRDHQLASNVDLDEVSEVAFEDICGVDEVIASLEANIVLPLENEDLGRRLDLKPKRGVLLAGPPGTGKTTVGRALARRLKGKFFLIDGTCISGTDGFYHTIDYTFEQAIENAPAIVFIDDSDVIFESGREHGLYRYLLTKLDGLESKSVGRVCVMMTAMDVGNIPPALVRSGRIELWLEMRLPDESARLQILTNYLAAVRDELPGLDLNVVADRSDGFTGADLKRLCEDGKTAYAYDLANDRPVRPLTDYFVEAIEAIHANKRRYEAAEERTRAQRPSNPAWFSPQTNYQLNGSEA